MKKIKTYTARRGDAYGQGNTKHEAKVELEKAIDWACSRFGVVVEKRFDWTIVISGTTTGVETMVFKDAELRHGQRRVCTTYQGPTDYKVAMESARMHAAHNAWSFDCDSDEAHVLASGLSEAGQKDLARWIKFQREYKRLIDAGHNRSDAFDIANGYKKEEASHGEEQAAQA